MADFQVQDLEQKFTEYFVMLAVVFCDQNTQKWLSPKRRQKRVKNLTSEWNQK